MEKTTLAAFAAAVILGGLNAVGIRLTVLELPPFWAGVLRFAPAALLLYLLVLFMRLPFPAGRGLWGAILFGVLDIGASAGFINWGMQEVPAGTGSIILSLVPLMTLLFAIAHGQEHFTGRALAGAIMAIAGIGAIYGSEAAAAVPLLSLLALLIGAACMAEANVLIKTFPPSNPISLNAVAMTSGGVILFALSLFFQETPALPAQPLTWFWLLYLIVLGSCAVFILFIFVLSRWTASATSYAYVLMSIVGVLAGALLLDEPLTLSFLLGAALVLGGVYIGALSQRKKARVRPEPVAVETVPDVRRQC